MDERVKYVCNGAVKYGCDNCMHRLPHKENVSCDNFCLERQGVECVLVVLDINDLFEGIDI